MRRYRWEILVALLLLTCTGFVFRAVPRAEFVRWDDDIVIYNNPHLTGLNVPALRWMFGAFDYVVRYQPFTWLTWAAIAQCAGLTPFAYHLANLILHGINSVLAFLLIRELLLRTLRLGGEGFPTRQATVCAGLGALVWAVHPMRVEAVAWVSAMPHCQALFFLLLSAFLYLRAHPEGSPELVRRGLYWGSVASYAASLLSFPVGLGFMVVPIVLDAWVLRRIQPGPRWWRGVEARRIWIEKLPFLGLAALMMAVALWARMNVGAGWIPAPSVAEFGLARRFMQACYIWAYYLWKPWVPFDLSPVYPTLLVFRPTDAPFGRSLMLLLAVTVVLVTQRRRWLIALALWVTYLVLLVPLLGLTEYPHYPSDRYSYAVGVLWSIALAAALWRLASSPGRFRAALAGCLLLGGGFAALSQRQVEVWRDSETLFRTMIARLGSHPYRGDIHWRLGLVLADQHKLDAATAQYQIALSLWPDLAEAHYALAVALEQQQKGNEAVDHYLSALRVSPDFADAHARVGLVLAKQGRKDEAVAHLRRAATLDPSLAGVRETLSTLLGETRP